jgi:hypothetical protein
MLFKNTLLERPLFIAVRSLIDTPTSISGIK